MQKTTTATLPQAVQAEYELPADLIGGPVFALTNVPGVRSVDLSKITLAEAANLVAHRCPLIRRRAEKAKPAEAAKN